MGRKDHFFPETASSLCWTLWLCGESDAAWPVRCCGSAPAVGKCVPFRSTITGTSPGDFDNVREMGSRHAASNRTACQDGGRCRTPKIVGRKLSHKPTGVGQRWSHPFGKPQMESSGFHKYQFRGRVLPNHETGHKGGRLVHQCSTDAPIWVCENSSFFLAQSS